jgi:hypothetical protein
VQPDRQLNPHAHEVRYIQSPVRCIAGDDRQSIVVCNDLDFTPLRALVASWTITANGVPIASGELAQAIDCMPQHSTRVPLPAGVVLSTAVGHGSRGSSAPAPSHQHPPDEYVLTVSFSMPSRPQWLGDWGWGQFYLQATSYLTSHTPPPTTLAAEGGPMRLADDGVATPPSLTLSLSATTVIRCISTQA